MERRGIKSVLYGSWRGSNHSFIHSITFADAFGHRICGTLLGIQGLHKHVDFLVSRCLLSPPPPEHHVTPPTAGVNV